MKNRKLNPNISNKKESKIPLQLYAIKSALILSLLTVSPMNQAEMQRKNNITKDIVTNQKEEEREVVMEGIKQAIMNVKSMNDLPKKIIYPEGMDEKYEDLPTIIDVNPKVLEHPVKSMIITIGNRKFDVEPLAVEIERIRFDEKNFIIETSWFTMEYSKYEKFPNFCYNLRKTPKGAGEKDGFPGVTVTDVTNTKKKNGR